MEGYSGIIQDEIRDCVSPSSLDKSYDITTTRFGGTRALKDIMTTVAVDDIIADIGSGTVVGVIDEFSKSNLVRRHG